ncbi:protein RhsD, partial [Escherichia coli EC1846]
VGTSSGMLMIIRTVNYRPRQQMRRAAPGR